MWRKFPDNKKTGSTRMRMPVNNLDMIYNFIKPVYKLSVTSFLFSVINPI